MVSYGEGGVRLLAHLTPEESVQWLPERTTRVEHSALPREEGEGEGPVPSPPLPYLEPGRAWNRLRGVLRSGVALLLLTGAALAQPQHVTAAPSAPGATVPANVLDTPDSQTVSPDATRQDQVDARRLLGPGGSLPSIDLRLGSGQGDDLILSGPVGTVILMGFLTVLPTVLLLMTGFTRILVVLYLLRQAIGTQSTPPGQLLAALALLLTGFVMAPTLATVNEVALAPWMDGQIDEVEMLKRSAVPFREFMLRNTGDEALSAFVEMSGTGPVERIEDVPLVVVTSAFVTSELKAAFQMGFALFLPFMVIDLVVASVLMSMGMFMLPPIMVSLPFKLLLFVLVDGWTLVMGSLVQSFS